MESKKLRILHVLPYHDKESSFIFAKRQVLALSEEGHTNETFFVKSRFSPIGLMKEYKRYKEQIKEFKPDIIHAHYGTITGYFASCFKSVPFVITFQGSDLNFTKDIGWLRERSGKRMSKIVAKRARKIICVSEGLQANLLAGKQKSIVIPSGISTTIFTHSDRSVCKKKLNLSPEKNYIFFNSNNPVVKRLDIATEVVEILKDLNVELLSLNGSVEPDDVPVYLNACVATILCSDSEGSPSVIKEAMACGLPVVSVDVGDVKDRISEVENCFIVPQDAHAIAEKVRYIIESKVPPTNGKEILKKQGIDSSSAAKKVAQVYFEALAGT